mgnify:CR=1 FL=1
MNKQHEKKMKDLDKAQYDLNEKFREENKKIIFDHEQKMKEMNDAHRRNMNIIDAKHEYNMWKQDQKYAYNIYYLNQKEKDLYNNYYYN